MKKRIMSLFTTTIILMCIILPCFERFKTKASSYKVKDDTGFVYEIYSTYAVAVGYNDDMAGAFNSLSFKGIYSYVNGVPVRYIGGSAFSRKSLTEITIPDTVYEILGGGIMTGAFAHTKIKTVTVPESVRKIGALAFTSCSELESIYILNPDCVIEKFALYDIGQTISNDADGFRGVIYGYKGSTAQAYAEKCGYNFVTIDTNEVLCTSTTTTTTTTSTTTTTTTTMTTTNTTTIPPAGNIKPGDANYDNQINMADAVFIMQCISNPDKYKFSTQGEINADVDGSPGITNMDALMIQKYKLGIISEEQFKSNIKTETNTTTSTTTTRPQEIIKSGKCGANIDWVLDKSGTLMISGTGDMPNGNPGWLEYRDHITSVVIKNGVTSIGDSAFYNLRKILSITIPDSVKYIGRDSFWGCTNLARITIPNSVTSISLRAFASCTSLTDLTIPNSVTNIGICAFASCTSLTDLTIPNSVSSIDISAFEGCTNLSSVTILDGVESIRYSAFANCTSLTKITIPKSVESIDDNAFTNCKDLTIICYSDSAAVSFAMRNKIKYSTIHTF